MNSLEMNISKCYLKMSYPPSEKKASYKIVAVGK